MKYRFVLLIVATIVYLGGHVSALNTPLLDVVPDKSFYRPGETVTLTITANVGSGAEVDVVYLNQTITTLRGSVDTGGEIVLTYNPPMVTPRGYGVDVRLLDANSTILATASTAFDVLDRWTQAPRYGFLSEFQPGRDNVDETMDWNVRYHVNGLQFYDWQYRHEALLPPSDLYADVLGRQLSQETVTGLIEAAHAHNIAAMPYTAIYGASWTFYEQHPDWALFQYPGHPYAFGENFLAIMDPTPGTPWAEHLLGEYRRVLEETAFDGIHIDQYGAPMVGLNSNVERVRLDEVFPAFIDQTAQLVEQHRGAEGAVIFNAVRNWPVETVAPSQQDAVYVEVWEPYRELIDLHRIVVEAQRLGGGKPVIIAAYIHPDNIHNVRLSTALIFASGGYHLELGEPQAMLADPYFPNFARMNEDTQTAMRRYHDFLVRYENRLALGTQDATQDRIDAVQIDGLVTHSRRGHDQVAVVVRHGEGFESFSLINLQGLPHGYWDDPLPAGPTPQTNLGLRIYVPYAVTQVWAASPDNDNLAAQPLAFTTGTDDTGSYINFTLPCLDYWQMIVLDYEA
jgi:dextranase